MEVTKTLHGWMTGKEMRDLKKYSDIDNITADHMEAFTRTNDEDSMYYNSTYDLEHKKLIYERRQSTYDGELP